MKMFRLLLLAIVFGSTAAVSAPVFAQGPGFGGLPVNRFNAPVNGLGRFRGFRRGLLGNSGIISYPSMHEFSRTIPRPYGNSILPFYSLYPPVYYSHSVARPYGFSPYALPAGMQPAEGLLVAADVDKTKEIINPFFKPEDDGEATEEEPKETQASTRVASTTKMIVNPYFRKADAIAPRVIPNPYLAKKDH